MPDTFASASLEADEGTVIGYRSARSDARELILGRCARIRSGSVLYLGSRIGANFQTGHNVVIREDCQIGDGVSVWSNSVVDYGCRIGDNVKVHANCYIAQFTEIAEEAFLAPGVMIANDLYPGQSASAAVMSGPWIGARAQIGVNATILPFVRIGAGCLIGAGAVVARDIPERSVAIGNPARVCGDVQDLVPIETRIGAVAGSASRYRLARAADGHPSLTGRRSR